MSRASYTFRVPAGIARELSARVQALVASSHDVALPLEQRHEAAGQAYEAIAALADAALPTGDAPRPAADSGRASLARLSAKELSRAAAALRTIVLDALEDPFDEPALEERVPRLERILSLRESVDRRFRGAVLAGLADVAPSRELADAVERFDATLRPVVWALAFANPMRERHASVMQPSQRERSWWWSEALDVNWVTVQRSTQVAALLDRYPSYEEHLRRLSHASRVVSAVSAGLPATPAASRPTSLELGETRHVAELAPGADVQVERNPEGYLLRVVADAPRRLGRRAKLVLGDGSQAPRVPGDAIAFRLGETVPGVAILEVALDGRAESRRLTLRR